MTPPGRSTGKAKTAKPPSATPPARTTARRKPETAGQAAMNAEHAFKRRDWDPRWLARFQQTCLSFPGVVEAEQFGGPWFKVGKKSFACYGAESAKAHDGHYHGVDGAAFNMTLMDQAALLEDPRFTKTHYIGQHGWVTMAWDEEPDWKEIRQLVESAYRKVAPARLLATSDASAPARSANPKARRP